MTDRTPSRTLSWLRAVVVVTLLLAVARTALYTTYKVAGASMRETLQDGDRVLVASHPWIAWPIDVGDTVILRVDGETLVKRVAAGPGERIAMRDGQVLRNGREVLETIPREMQVRDSFPDYRLREGEYFVLGDNRRVSVDSRDFGPVSAAQFLGRVVLRVDGISVSTVAALERPGG